MWRRPVRSGGVPAGGFSLLHALSEQLQLALEAVNQLPLLRDSGVQLVNGRLLMRNADFQGVDAGVGGGCVGHGEGCKPPCGPTQAWQFSAQKPHKQTTGRVILDA